MRWDGMGHEPRSAVAVVCVSEILPSGLVWESLPTPKMTKYTPRMIEELRSAVSAMSCHIVRPCAL